MLVSDFYTPNFFDPVVAPGVRYSFTGRISRPRQILPGGYISWFNPQIARMQQLRFFGDPQIVTLNGHPAKSGRKSLRGFVDSQTTPPARLSSVNQRVAAGGFQAERASWFQSAAVTHGATFLAAKKAVTPTESTHTKEEVQAVINTNQTKLLVARATRTYAGWHFEDGWIPRFSMPTWSTTSRRRTTRLLMCRTLH